MYKEDLKGYLDGLASRKSVPGGGSAAALAGALGVALLSKVANFTIGKKGYQDVESQMQKILESTENLRQALERLIDDDVFAYQKVREAYKLPQANKEEEGRRNVCIQKALKKALEVPLEVCRKSVEAITWCEFLLEKGNKNLISDVGVAAELLDSSFNSALLNVQINLSAIKDVSLKNRIREELLSQEKRIASIKERIVRETKERI